jgi:hypothetical protein
MRDDDARLVLEDLIAVVQEEDDVIPAVPRRIVPYLHRDDRPMLGKCMPTAMQDLRFSRFGIDFDEIRRQR